MSRVLRIHDGAQCRVETSDGEVRADAVVVATHTPLGITALHMELEPYSSYVIAARLKSPVPRAASLLWDNDEPYHYVRPHRESTGSPPMIIVGGEDHKTGTETQTHRRYERLEEWTRRNFDVDSVAECWSTELFESVDGLPFVGAIGSRVFVAAGFAGDGLTFGTMAASMLAARLTGAAHELTDVLKPRRLKLRSSLKRLVKANISVASHFIVDRFAAGERRSLLAVARNSGAIVSVGGRKVAAYRDDAGNLHMLSALCRHMKCLVQWNDTEHTWDCPCHGSRYEATGAVISAPATEPLLPVADMERSDEEAPHKRPYRTPVQPVATSSRLIDR